MIDSANELGKKKFSRIVKKILIVSGILFALVGFYGVIEPRHLVFNNLISKHYAKEFENPTVKEYEKKIDTLNEIEHEKLEKKPFSEEILKLFNEFVNSPDKTKEEMKEALFELEKAQEIAKMKHPEMVALMAPTQIASSLVMGFGLYCLLLAFFCKIEPTLNTVLPHLTFHISFLIGLIAMLASRGESLTSSTFTIMSMLVDIVFIIVWVLVYNKIPPPIQN